MFIKELIKRRPAVVGTLAVWYEMGGKVLSGLLIIPFLVSAFGDDLSGVWTIQDRMNKRWTQRIDFLVNKTRKGGKWNNVIIKLIE